MSLGIMGKKIGMTRVFDPEGNRVAVTVIEATPNTIVRLKTEDGPDGYNAAVMGFGKVKDKQLNKPKKGFFAKQGVEPRKHLRETRLSSDEVAGLSVGQEIGCTLFAPGNYVDVVGTTKGHGFTGVIKRHNFHQPKMTHGTHEKFRHGGSLGQCTTPGRVYAGKKMAGQHGNSRVTVQNLMVVGVEADRNLILIKGGVPGPNGRLVWIQPATKV